MDLKDMDTYALLLKVWEAAIETTKAGGKRIKPCCTFFDVHFHIEDRLTTLTSALAAEKARVAELETTLERSRVRETAKEPPEGDEMVTTWNHEGFWRVVPAHVVRRFPGTFPLWQPLPLPPSPKGNE